MTRKHKIKKYQALLKEVETSDFYSGNLTNRVNCYVCDACHHVTKTKDVDAGVTPFLHLCENCKHMARSTFYNDVRPMEEPTEEWYRPSLEEVLKMDEIELDHIFNGGLIPRKISTKDG